MMLQVCCICGSCVTWDLSIGKQYEDIVKDAGISVYMNGVVNNFSHNLKAG